MKKVLIWLLCVVVLISIPMGIGCKNTTVTETTASETTTAETAASETTGAETTASDKSSEPTGEPIKFGVSTALSGDSASYGKPFLDVILMIADMFNKEGGILGRPVEVVYYDDKGSPDEALSICKKLVYEDKCQIIQPGSTSGCIMTGMTVAKDEKIAQWGYGLAKDFLAEGEGMIFRPAVPDEVNVAALAKFAYEKENVKTISMIILDTFYGETSKNIFTKFYESYGGKVIDVTTYTEGDRDFSSQLMTISKSNPEGVYLVCQGGAAAALIKQAVDFLPDNIKIFGDNAWQMPAIREQAGEIVSHISGGYSHPAVYVNPDPLTQQWIKAIEDTLGEGKYSEIMARAVVGMTVMREAIENAGTLDGIAIMKEVHKIKDFPTMMGPYTYDPRDGEGLKTGVVIKPSAEGLMNDEIVFTNTVTEPLYEKAPDYTRFFGEDYYKELLESKGLEDIK